MGAWTYVLRRIEYILDDTPEMRARRPIYVGRPEAASPATGVGKIHNAQQEQIVDQALNWDRDDLRQPFQRVTDDELGEVLGASPVTTAKSAAKKASAICKVVGKTKAKAMTLSKRNA